MKKIICTVMVLAFLANVSAPAAYGQVIVKNAQENVPGLVFINRLRPLTFNWDLGPIENLWWNPKFPFDELSQEMKDILVQAREAKEAIIQTGFIAQEVDTAAQNIGYYFSGVDVDETGIYGLRYAEFVVPLVKAVQELSVQNKWLMERIYELTGDIYDLQLKSGRIAESTTGLQDVISSAPSLQQNTPNPFKEQTEIRYFLPGNIQSAYVCIFDMQGAMLKKMDAPAGTHTLIVKGSELKAGMYLYALIADGKEVDTKRMILTK